MLSESQLAALEKAKADKEAHGEFESECQLASRTARAKKSYETNCVPLEKLAERVTSCGPKLVATENSERVEKSRVLGWAAVVSPACSHSCVSSFLFLSADSVAGRFLN